MFLGSAIKYVFDIRFSEIQDASSTLGSMKWPKSAPPRSSDHHSPRLGIVAAQSAGIDEPPTPDQTPKIEFLDFVNFLGLLQNFFHKSFLYLCFFKWTELCMDALLSLLMEEVSKL